MSQKVIRSLGEEFCKVSEEQLSSDNLVKKRKPKSAIGGDKAAGKGKDAQSQKMSIKESNDDKKIEKIQEELIGQSARLLLLILVLI